MSTMAKGSSFVLHRCGKAVDLVSFSSSLSQLFVANSLFPRVLSLIRSTPFSVGKSVLQLQGESQCIHPIQPSKLGFLFVSTGPVSQVGLHGAMSACALQAWTRSLSLLRLLTWGGNGQTEKPRGAQWLDAERRNDTDGTRFFEGTHPIESSSRFRRGVYNWEFVFSFLISFTS